MTPVGEFKIPETANRDVSLMVQRLRDLDNDIAHINSWWIAQLAKERPDLYHRASQNHAEAREIRDRLSSIRLEVSQVID